MTTTKSEVFLGEVFDAMRQCYRRSLEAGRNWHAVTVGADGEPYVREEVSRCVSPAEHDGHPKPHPVTVWSVTGSGGGLDEDEVDHELDAFDPEEAFAGQGGVPELTRRLEEAGFAVVSS